MNAFAKHFAEYFPHYGILVLCVVKVAVSF